MTATKSTPKIPPKPGKDTIYVDVDDEITSIIEKVDAAKQKVVALVLPKRATVLQSVVNMRLLKRSADKAGKNVVLITGEEALLPLAGAAGLHVAKNLQTKPEVPAAPAAAIKVAEAGSGEDLDAPEEEPSTKLDYHRSVGELAAVKAISDSDSVELEDEDEEEENDGDKEKESPKTKSAKPPKDKKLKVPDFDRFRMMLIAAIGLFILLVVFLPIAVFALPKGTITITTGSTAVSFTTNLNASDKVKALDIAGKNIPAVVKTSNQTSTQQVPATGQQNNGSKATGAVSVSTACTKLPSNVPAGSSATSGGLTFITTNDLKFKNQGVDSQGNFICGGDVNVQAAQGGSKYNLDSGSSFSVSAYSGSNNNALSGGTDNITTVVSQTDLNNASSKISPTDTAKFIKDFETQLASQGLYVLTSTLKAGTPTTTANPAVGQPASNTTVTTTVTYTVLALQKSDLTKLMSDGYSKQIDATKQKLNDGNPLEGMTITVQDQSAPNVATITVSGDTTAVPIIDQAKIKQQSVGKKIGDIKSAVQGIPGVKKVDVHLSPFWVSKAPKASKITVVQVQVKGSGG